VLELVAAVDGSVWTRISAPDVIAPRAWFLGVVAVQLVSTGEGVSAQARRSRTGESAEVLPLASEALVQIALVEAGAEPRFPSVPRLPIEGAARLACIVDGERLDEVTLAPARLAEHPRPRAFAHAYCRWLRSGEIEAGFDLTDFLSRAPGEMYERRLHRPLARGGVVSYRVTCAS
jgi:hypothetical protein